MYDKNTHIWYMMFIGFTVFGLAELISWLSFK